MAARRGRPPKSVTEKEEIIEPVTYFSKYSNLTVKIRASRKDVINGEVIYTPGKTAEFHNGQLTTKDPEIIDKMDSLLRDSSKNWARFFQRAPSKKQMEKIQRIARKMDEIKHEAMEEIKNESEDEESPPAQEMMALEVERRRQQALANIKEGVRHLDTD